LIVTEKSVILNKLFYLENEDAKKEPLTGILFNKKNLYVSRGHNAIVYRDFLTGIANIIIQK
jgi:hypothetical protein